MNREDVNEVMRPLMGKGMSKEEWNKVYEEVCRLLDADMREQAERTVNTLVRFVGD